MFLKYGVYVIFFTLLYINFIPVLAFSLLFLNRFWSLFVGSYSCLFCGVLWRRSFVLSFSDYIFVCKLSVLLFFLVVCGDLIFRGGVEFFFFGCYGYVMWVLLLLSYLFFLERVILWVP